MVNTPKSFELFVACVQNSNQGCGVGRFFRIPTPDSDSSCFEKPTPPTPTPKSDSDSTTLVQTSNANFFLSCQDRLKKMISFIRSFFIFLDFCCRYEHPIVPPPDDYDGDFFSDLQNALVGVGIILKEDNVYQLDKDYNNMSKFLNRILGMPVELQNRLFKYFTDTLAAIVTQAKKTGKYDMGILDLGMGGEGCKRTKTRTWVSKHSTGTAKTDLHTVTVERGLSWEQAKEKFEELKGDLEGFYISHQVCGSLPVVLSK